MLTDGGVATPIQVLLFIWSNVMKYKGKKVEGPNEEIVVIPRGDEVDDFIFICRAIPGYEDFDKIVKEPEPRSIMRKGDLKSSPLLDEPEYKEKLKVYELQRLSWLIVQSLKATEDLEWDTIDYNDPETWGNYDSELRSSGFSSIEIGRIVRGVMIANSLDQRKVDEARQSFLAMRRQEAIKLSSPQEDQKTTPSGEPANVSL